MRWRTLNRYMQMLHDRKVPLFASLPALKFVLSRHCTYVRDFITLMAFYPLVLCLYVVKRISIVWHTFSSQLGWDAGSSWKTFYSFFEERKFQFSMLYGVIRCFNFWSHHGIASLSEGFTVISQLFDGAHAAKVPDVLSKSVSASSSSRLSILMLARRYASGGWT